MKQLRSHIGREFSNQRLQNFFQSQCMIHQLTTPYLPEQNRVVEQHNRILITKIRAMLYWGQLPNSFWGYAVFATAVIKNFSISKSLEGNTPYGVAYNTKEYTNNHLRT